jgi:hypothetical protein
MLASMVERVRTALLAAGEEIRGFLERLYVPEDPGRFRLCIAGSTPSGERAALAPSCLALRVSRRLGLWDSVDKDEQSQWIAFVAAYQKPDPIEGEPGTRGAFLDPEVVAATRGAHARRGRWIRGFTRAPSALEDLARASTRTAIAALACVDAYPQAPYRDLPTAPAELDAELRRSDWKRPAAAAARSADLIALIMSQGRHFLALPDLHRLRDAAARFLESLIDRKSGAFFTGPPPPAAEQLAGAAHVLDAFEWMGRPAPEPQSLLETCLGVRPGRDCDVADWASVVRHCARSTHHRRGELADAALGALESILEHRQRDGGWSLQPGGMATHDGPLEISDGRPGGDLLGTERLTGAAAMLVELLEWDAPRWPVLRR